MVTLPTEAAAGYGLVCDLLKHGTDCARINCAHDGLPAWRAMVRNIRRAERETGRPCRILMDLGGPRLRTGPVETGKPLLRIKVRRDVQGRPLQPAPVILDASGPAGHVTPTGKTDDSAPARVAVERTWLDRLRRGDAVDFVDLRRRKRRSVVEKRLSETACLARTSRGAWIDETTVLTHVPRRGKGRRGETTPVGAIATAPLDIRLENDDLLLLTREPVPGEPKRMTKRGKMLAPAHISCSEPRIFPALKIGHHVWIDNGKIGAVIEALDERGAWLRITQARPGGERVGPGKGLDFPDSEMPLPALCESDLANLGFAARHADIIGFSFVRSAADMDELVRALGDLGHAGPRRAGQARPAVTRRNLGRRDVGTRRVRNAEQGAIPVTGAFGARQRRRPHAVSPA